MGEIQLRGPNVFAGYRDNPVANRQAFTEDGWFRTGDLGCLDADGFLLFQGRQKELIVLGGGKNAFPRSEEHTSELQSLMRISYAVFCLKKKTNIHRKLNIKKIEYMTIL